MSSAASTLDLSRYLADFEARHPQFIDLSLERVLRAARALGVDAPGFPIIAVGGTNGKGSTVAMLEALLQEAGIRCCAYTSPHLLHVAERFRFNGGVLADEQIARAFEKVELCAQAEGLTWFEFTTLAAMQGFCEVAPQVAVLEIGLGGRLDAVNAWDNQVGVVTSLALDHSDRLGHSRERIGWEKASIARRGRPLICGDRAMPRAVAATAAEKGANLLRLGVDFERTAAESNFAVTLADGRELKKLSLPELPGDWQEDNAACALQALASVDGLLPDEGVISAALKKARLSGRFDRRRIGGAELILDVAHNPAAVSALSHALGHLPLQSSGARIFAVPGIMADKESRSMLRLLAPQIARWFVGALEVPRALGVEELKAQILEVDGEAEVLCCGALPAAVERALDQARPGDRVLVFGSFYTVSEWLQQADKAD